MTKRRICVAADGNGRPYIFVQEDQLGDVKGVLDHANIRYTVDVSVIQSDSVAPTNAIRLRDGDAQSAQEALDEAAVKVSIQLVDGSFQEYFQPQSLIERYESLRRGGSEGNELVHELITDDWGAPPSAIKLEGYRDDGTTFRVSLSYDSRKNRRR